MITLSSGRTQRKGTPGAVIAPGVPCRVRDSGSCERERLAFDPSQPEVLRGRRHLGEALLDRGEHVAGHPARVAVDQQVVASVEDREVGRALVAVRLAVLFVAVRGVADFPGFEPEVHDVAGDRRDRGVLPPGLRLREGRHESIDLVARVLRVVSRTALRQRVPHRLARPRRLVVEQPRPAGDPALVEGDRDVPGHAQLPVTDATTSPQMRSASSTCSAVTTSGGTMRTTFMYGPQVSSSRPFFDAVCWAAAAVAASGSPSAVVNSEPTSSPSPRTSPIAGVLSAINRAPSSSWRPRSAAFSTRFSRWMTSRVAIAAAHETALPPYVPPCEPGNALAISSSEAAMPDSGKPLARPFAVTRMSGVTPKWSWPQKRPVRPTPVCTSSRMRRKPWRSARSRRPSMNARVAGTYPPSPSTGSTMIAAVSAGEEIVWSV